MFLIPFILSGIALLVALHHFQAAWQQKKIGGRPVKRRVYGFLFLALSLALLLVPLIILAKFAHFKFGG